MAITHKRFLYDFQWGFHTAIFKNILSSGVNTAWKSVQILKSENQQVISKLMNNVQRMDVLYFKNIMHSHHDRPHFATYYAALHAAKDRFCQCKMPCFATWKAWFYLPVHLKTAIIRQQVILKSDLIRTFFICQNGMLKHENTFVLLYVEFISTRQHYSTAILFFIQAATIPIACRHEAWHPQTLALCQTRSYLRLKQTPFMQKKNKNLLNGFLFCYYQRLHYLCIYEHSNISIADIRPGSQPPARHFAWHKSYAGRR